MQNKSESQLRMGIHPVEIAWTWLIVSVMILGLSNWDKVFRIALFGPIFMFSIGAFFQICISEKKHRFTVALDSYISRIFNVDVSGGGHIYSRRMITLCISLLAFSCLLISIKIMANINTEGILIDTPSWFALFMFLFASLTGICLARIMVGISLKNPMDAGEKEWSQLQEEDKEREYQEFYQWLKTSNSTTIHSNRHSNRVQNQRASFLRYIRRLLISEERENIIKIFQSEKHIDSKAINEMAFQLIDKLKPECRNWLHDCLVYFDKDDYDTLPSIHAILLLPVISELLRDFIPDETVPDKIVDNLFTILSQFIVQLQYDEMVLPDDISASGAIEHQLSEEVIHFIRAISISAIENPKYNWEPWWILNIRCRMLVLMNSTHWPRLKVFSDREGVDVAFSAMAALLSKSRISSSKGKRVGSTTFDNLVAEQIESQDLSPIQGHPLFFRDLEHSAPSTSVPVHSALMKAWALHQTIISRDAGGEKAAEAFEAPVEVEADETDEESESEVEAEDEEDEAAEVPEQEAAPSVGDYSFSEDVLSKILKKHDISDRDAFLEHAIAFDEAGNLYLKKSELEKAAEAFEAPVEVETNEESEVEPEDEEDEEDEAAEEPDEDEDDDDEVAIGSNEGNSDSEGLEQLRRRLQDKGRRLQDKVRQLQEEADRADESDD